MLNLLNIVSRHHLREVGYLLRRASIKQRLSFMRKKLLGGVMVKAFLPCFMKYTVDILSVISHIIITGVRLVKSSISVSITASIEWQMCPVRHFGINWATGL